MLTSNTWGVLARQAEGTRSGASGDADGSRGVGPTSASGLVSNSDQAPRAAKEDGFSAAEQNAMAPPGSLELEPEPELKPQLSARASHGLQQKREAGHANSSAIRQSYNCNTDAAHGGPLTPGTGSAPVWTPAESEPVWDATPAVAQHDSYAENPLLHDVCICGSGVAGIVLAVGFEKKGLRVLMLEGSDDGDEQHKDLYCGETAGDVATTNPTFTEDTRDREFGGSSNRWGGWCPRLRDVDLQSRTVGDRVRSGWPVDSDELSRYYARAESMLSSVACGRETLARQKETMGNMLIDETAAVLISHFPERLRPKSLTHQSYPVFGNVQFQNEFEDALRAEKITVLRDANVLRVLYNDNRISGIEYARNSGETRVATATHYILACGGLENPRIMLNSGLDSLEMFSQLGRNFAVHPYVRNFGEVEWNSDGPHKETISRATLDEQMLFQRLGLKLDGPFFRWVPTEQVLRDKQLPNFAVLTRNGQLQLTFEQLSCDENHVSLSQTERDKFGMPRIRVNLSLTEQDKAALLEIGEILRHDLVTCGLANKISITADSVSGLNLRKSELWFGEHHMGATRMSASPQDGVCDSNCRVHGIRNLYLAGSSVFPSFGAANPTLTIIAMALRMVDQISAHGVRTVEPVPRPSALMAWHQSKAEAETRQLVDQWSTQNRSGLHRLSHQLSTKTTGMVETKYTEAQAIWEALEAHGGQATRLVRASWLMTQRGGRLPKCGDLPSNGYISVSELREIHENIKKTAQWTKPLPIVAISYCWRTPEDTDPDGETLEIIIEALSQRWNEFSRQGATDVGVFIDWCSIFQAPRTSEQTRIFGESLKTTNLCANLLQPCHSSP